MYLYTVTFGIGLETYVSLCSLYYVLKLCITINDILIKISYIWYTMAHNNNIAVFFQTTSRSLYNLSIYNHKEILFFYIHVYVKLYNSMLFYL